MATEGGIHLVHNNEINFVLWRCPIDRYKKQNSMPTVGNMAVMNGLKGWTKWFIGICLLIRWIGHCKGQKRRIKINIWWINWRRVRFFYQLWRPELGLVVHLQAPLS